MLEYTDIITLTSLVLSVFASVIAAVRFKTESKLQSQADQVTTLYDIVRIIDSDRAVESRGILRENNELNYIKNNDPDSTGFTLPPLDERTHDAARFIATTYDRLGFIVKHQPRLEKEILDWNGEVIADMWLLTRHIIKKELRARYPNYAREFERLGIKALSLYAQR